jgi:hypothetical protein
MKIEWKKFLPVWGICMLAFWDIAKLGEYQLGLVWIAIAFFMAGWMEDNL